MNQKTNYQKILDETISRLAFSKTQPSLLLHSCCGPCSSAVLEYLATHFIITIFYDNPNIYPTAEYWRRFEEQKKLLHDIYEDGTINQQIPIIEKLYDPERFYTAVTGFETEKEGSERCFRCYSLRLTETAHFAAKNGFDYFTTTLSISPFKNAEWINQIGESLSIELQKEGHHTQFLHADFKKKNGFKRSLELSQRYGLYRQQYCGCIYSATAKEQKPTAVTV